MKDKDKIVEIQPFEIENKSKSKQIKILEPSNQSKSVDYESDEILNFNLYVNYTKPIYFKEGKGNYDPVYHKGELTEFKKVGKDKGSYMRIVSDKKEFYLILLANCPKCNHDELLVDSTDNIHTTLLELEDNFGDRYQDKDEGSKIISKFGVKTKNEDNYEYFDLDLKCLKCSREIYWYMTEDTENEVCNKMWEAFG